MKAVQVTKNYGTTIEAPKGNKDVEKLKEKAKLYMKDKRYKIIK